MKLIDLKIGDRFFFVDKSDLPRYGLEEQDEPFIVEETPYGEYMRHFRVYSRTKAVVVVWGDEVEVSLLK
jgi:hypothetical protein